MDIFYEKLIVDTSKIFLKSAKKLFKHEFFYRINSGAELFIKPIIYFLIDYVFFIN